MDSITLLRQQLQAAHWLLESTMADVTPEQAMATPPGTANPLGASYAHAVFAEDGIINGMMQQQPPLLATTWAGRTGVSETMPVPGGNWDDYGPWARRVQVDLPALREYAQAVYAHTDAFLASLTPDALDQEHDLSQLGIGTQNLAWMLDRLVIGHADNMCGEISVLKGIQSARGYPF